jgi:O-antigen/teichoic acid export membrane protein
MSVLFGRGLLYVVVAALPYVTAAVVSPILAYVLGPRGLGLMATALAIHQVLLIVATVGLDQALVLERAEHGHDESARGLIGAGIAVGAGVSLLAGVTAPLWAAPLGFDGADALVLATVFWTTPASTVVLVLALLNSPDRLRAFTVVSFLSTVGGQILGLTLLFTVGRSAAVYAWGAVAGQVLAMVVGVLLVRPRWRGLVDLHVLTPALRLGLPLMLSTVSRFVLDAGDRLVVQSTLGPVEAGRYQVGYTVGDIGITVVALTSTAWAARLAEIPVERERLAMIGRSRDALYSAFAPVILGVVLGAPLALRLVAPPSFEPESLLPVVLLVVVSGIPVLASLASARALITARRGRPLVVATTIAAGLNIALNIVWIPSGGLVAAAASTAIAMTVQAVLQRWLLPKGIAWPRTPARCRLLLLVTCIMASASLLLPQDPFWIGVRTLAGLLCIPWLLRSLNRARRGGDPVR